MRGGLASPTDYIVDHDIDAFGILALRAAGIFAIWVSTLCSLFLHLTLLVK